MINPKLVADAVVHPYNLAPLNQNPEARSQLESVYAAHVMATGVEHAEHILTRDEFFSDFPFEAMARALFVESDVDFAVIHALPNLGFAKGYVTDPQRAAVLRDQYPGRFALFATVDTPVVDEAIAQLERQVRELHVDGLKLYPAFFYRDRAEGWRMDADDFATPLLEAARDLGIRNVAVHKALWLPPAPRSAFDIDDLSGALERFSSLNFQMVHAGSAFLEQTAALLAQYPNFYATLESTFAYAVVRPRVFAQILGVLLRDCGPDQLMFASGTNLSHPSLLLNAFTDFEFPADLAEEQGFPELTEEVRRKILGGNLLRMLDMDPAEIRARTAGDTFAQERAGGGDAPWSAIRTPYLTESPG